MNFPLIAKRKDAKFGAAQGCKTGLQNTAAKHGCKNHAARMIMYSIRRVNHNAEKNDG